MSRCMFHKLHKSSAHEMRNTVLILIAVLMAVWGVLAVISSSGEYAAEKLFYRAMKTYKKIADNPDVAPPAMLVSVENDLKRIVEKYPDSQTAKATRLVLAEFYLRNKDYEQALSALDEIINVYTQDKLILSKAHFLKGAAYEKQNQWEKALQEYAILRNEYTDTPLGLQVPLYLGAYYSAKERYLEAEQAYNEAVLFYEKLAAENKGKAYGYAAANFLLQVQMNLRNYEQAGKVLQDIINDYPNLLTFSQQLPKIEAIFVKKLNKPDKALQVYEIIRDKTDNQKLLEFLDGRIAALNVQINEQ